jgi:hypothetical protein
MPKKRYTPEEIVAKLRQVDVLVSQGQNIADAIRQIGVAKSPIIGGARSTALASQVVVEIERSAGYAERIITRSIDRAGRE